MTSRARRPRLHRATVPALLAMLALLASSAVGERAALARSLVAVPDTYSVRHDRTLTVAAPGVLANDAGLSGQPNVERASNTSHGSLTLSADGGFTYTPGVDYVGEDKFRYHVVDGQESSNVATVTIMVESSPTPPPTPKPTPVPTPAPTPTPRPTLPPLATLPPLPTPRPLLPTLPPGDTPTLGPTPTGSTPSPDARPSPSIDNSSPRRSAAPGSTPTTGGPSSTDPPSASGGFRVGGGPAGDGGGGMPIGGIDGVTAAAMGSLPGGLLAWSYPAIVMTLPGILLLIAIGAQALGAVAWLPIVRRRVGAFGVQRKREAP